MNIIKAITDDNLFKPFLGNLKTWGRWGFALRALYGLPIRKSKGIDLVKKCTGRDTAKLPKRGFDTALFLTGRRSGKSRIAAIIGAYEAVLSGKEKSLAPGELGLVAILAPTTKQARIVKSYLRAIFNTDMLAAEIVSDTKEGFILSNGVRIEIQVGDWRSIRGYTLLAVIVDEICFFGYTEESKVRSDTELIRAIKPGLITLGGRLICISSPYAKRGWAYKQWKKCWGNDKGRTLVWNCTSRTMNPTLPKSVIDEAYEEDLASAKAEYGGEWREDVALFIDRAIVEQLVKTGRQQLLRHHNKTYLGFCDVTGGRNDSASLCIGHKDKGKDVVIVDFLKQYKAPLDPYAVAVQMSKELKRYKLKRVTGDNYAAEFVVSSFKHNGIKYSKAGMNKSQLYLELLPVLCSRGVELVDNEVLVDQIASLERKTRSGGRDIVDHPQGGHDDLANAVAGLVALTTRGKKYAGAMFHNKRKRRRRMKLGA